jgi:hypothetical protein
MDCYVIQVLVALPNFVVSMFFRSIGMFLNSLCRVGWEGFQGKMLLALNANSNLWLKRKTIHVANRKLVVLGQGRIFYKALSLRVL